MINKQNYYKMSIEAAQIQMIPCAITQKAMVYVCTVQPIYITMFKVHWM